MTSDNKVEEAGRAVLLADISGSTALYESVGDGEAARRVFQCIDFMRGRIEANSGVFVSAKGDDVLAHFESCDDSLSAARAILLEFPATGLSVHAGLHFGSLVSSRGDIFGDTVNTTARLANSANPGEVLVSGEIAARVSDSKAAMLQRMSRMNLKGKAQQLEVFSLNLNAAVAGINSTVVDLVTQRQGTATVTISHGAERFVLEDGAKLTLGRAPDNDLVIALPWVSRRHATLAVTDGRAQLIDSSSYGSYLIVAGGVEIAVHREATILTGAGQISPGMSLSQDKAAIIEFEVTG